jgi:integrase
MENHTNLKSLTQVNRTNGVIYTMKDNKNRFFFPDEYGKFEDQLKKKQRFSVRFLLNTGARINEARNVRVEDIDIERRRLVLRVTKAKAKKGEIKGKGRPRIIPLSSQFTKYLKGYINHKKLQPEDYLGILSNPALNIAYKKAAKEAGINDYWNISSHTFRKTLEVWLMALGVDSLPLTAHIGHDLKTAAQYYVSPDIFSWEEKKKIRMFIGDLYER